ncbi:MAG TPA: c-type cytochrome [Longimicrobiales bacterium]|nr:c-type cytochrome [Longimicrobiales bacterium]
MREWLRRIGVGVLVLLALVLAAGSAAFAIGTARIDDVPEVDTHAFDASTGDATSGAELVRVFGCIDCHGGKLEGRMLVDATPMGRVAAPNLTPGRAGGPLTDEQWERAIRHGVGADGRALFILPSNDYVWLSDRDVADLIAYLRTVPAVPDTLPPRGFGPLGRTLVGLGMIDFAPDLMPPDARHLDAPARAATPEYGFYLTRLCAGCHGRNLAGGPMPMPGSPLAANLTPAGNLARWTYEDFERTLRTGVTPEGKSLDPMFMPWPSIGQSDDTALRAMWAYLKTLEPVATEE